MSWQPPPDDPPHITKAAYYAKLREYFQAVEQEDIVLEPQGAYQAVPVFLAAWCAQPNDPDAERIRRAADAYCTWFDQETHTCLTKGEFGWADYFLIPALPYFVLALREMAVTPPLADTAAQITARLRAVLRTRAAGYPLYSVAVQDPIGAYSRVIGAAHFYELALHLNPDLPNAAQLRAFVESAWQS
jgi:hypothetical protein